MGANKKEPNYAIYECLLEFDNLLGLNIEEKSNEDVVQIPHEVLRLAQDRWNAKQNKNYALADELRKQITSLGYVVKDSKNDFIIEKI